MDNLTYTEQITKIRSNNIKFFRDSPDSPLTEQQKQDFKELSYFPVDEKYRLELELIIHDDPDEITILASGGDERKSIRYGTLEFELNGQQNKLTVFKPSEQDYLFLPFKDKTTGTESYRAGRYAELVLISDNKYVLDFNLSYNPYCAYNERYSCTLTPLENVLSIPIPAGEKNYHE